MALGLLRVLAFLSRRPAVAHGSSTELVGDPMGRLRTVADPFEGGVQLTPSDSATEITTEHRALWIGTGGTLAAVILDADGTTRRTIATSVGDATVFPFRCLRVLATGTTATGIVAGY